MLRSFLVILFLIFLFPLFCFSQETVGPRSAALGHASSCLTDLWSIRNNQAGLAFIKQTEVGVFGENRFFIKDLNYSGFGVASPVKKGVFGFGYSSFGYKLFRQSHVNLAYALKLSEQVSVGISLDYLNTKIGDVYGRAHQFTGSFGLTAKVLPQLKLSTHIYNPFRVQLANYNNERSPSIIKFGAQYFFSETLFLLAEIEKKSFQKSNLKAGIEYKTSSIVYIRVGASSYPAQAHFGFGVYYHQLQIDISSMYHNVIGLSPQIGLRYSFIKSSQNDNRAN